MEASRCTYMGSLVSRAGLSNTLLGTNIRLCLLFWRVPSGVLQVTSCQMVRMGGPAVINRSLTHPWPTPPGLAVARMYTLVPGPLGRFRENR